MKEDISLRNRVSVYADRQEAGRRLAAELGQYRGADALVLAIPSGGVPVAYEIAKGLGLPLDLVIVRKLQIPGNPEAGFGAMQPDGEVIFNEQLMARLRLGREDVDRAIRETMEVIEKRDRKFRGGRPFPPCRGRRVIIADDGLASGYTMRAAIRFIRRMGPASIIVAAPTGSEHTVRSLLQEADEIVCPNVRTGFPFAVADAYFNWYDLGDEEVLSLVGKTND